jgi:hypothetical protein
MNQARQGMANCHRDLLVPSLIYDVTSYASGVYLSVSLPGFVKHPWRGFVGTLHIPPRGSTPLEPCFFIFVISLDNNCKIMYIVVKPYFEII